MSRLSAPRVDDPLAGVRRFVRTSPWLAIALAVHVIVGAAFAVIQLSHDDGGLETHPRIEVGLAAPRYEPLPLPPEPEELFNRREIPENEPAELISEATPTFPLFEDIDVDYRLDRGNPSVEPGTDSGSPEGPPGAPGGTSIGVGNTGHVGTGVSPFSTPRLGSGLGPGTGTGTGPGYGRPGGPTQLIDEAILDGMLWLARHQDESGRWSGATCSAPCPAESPCQPETALEQGLYSTQADVGLTSLALLSFLGAGFSPNAEQFVVDTRAGRKVVLGKDVILPGLRWLKQQQRPDGSFSDGGAFFLYNEALAALALCEAYGLTRNPYWQKPAQRAIDFICRAQKPSPLEAGRLWGWRYQPAAMAAPGAPAGSELAESDVSVTGWMVMALKSAELAGLKVPRASIEGALDFVRWSTGQDGQVGYLGPETAGEPLLGEHDEFAYHLGTMSSIGMCVRIFLEQDRADPFLAEGAQVLLADLPQVGRDPASPQTDYYYWYYGSLALNQFDGPDAPRRTNAYWGPWNKAMNDTVLALQDQAQGACSFGGWMAPDRWSYGFGPVYTTAINVLTLEVYYRYENALGSARPSRGAAAVLHSGAAAELQRR